MRCKRFRFIPGPNDRPAKQPQAEMRSWWNHWICLSVFNDLWISELGEHWFRVLLVAWPVPGYFISHCYRIVIDTTRNISPEKTRSKCSRKRFHMFATCWSFCPVQALVIYLNDLIDIPFMANVMEFYIAFMVKNIHSIRCFVTVYTSLHFNNETSCA